MIKEFEGKTEKEAIDIAVAELGLEQGEFDVEIIETTKKSGFFRRGMVKIRIHAPGIEEAPEVLGASKDTPPIAENRELEEKLITHLEKILDMMGCFGKGKISRREKEKICIDIESAHNGILIGKRGKNLDALQLIVNIYAGRLGYEQKVILDSENYRVRREENIVRMARRISEEVRKTHGSRLLEPMNPFERRLIHTTLSGMEDIDTKSEGEGLLKQVRIIYRSR